MSGSVLLDFETRSSVDLGSRGLHNYVLDPAGGILCLCLQVDDGIPKAWLPGDLRQRPALQYALRDRLIHEQELRAILSSAKRFVAHNAAFERHVWQSWLTKEIEVPVPPLFQWDCTMARAAAAGLPLGLGDLAACVGIPQQKGKTGKSLISRLCVPQGYGAAGPKWCEDPDLLIALVRYCLQDVAVEAELDRRLPPLTQIEHWVWELDQMINDRGVAIDPARIHYLTEQYQIYESYLGDWFREVTGVSPRQVQKVMEYLVEQVGPDAPENLRRGTLEEWLQEHPEISDELYSVIQARMALGRSATVKLQKILVQADDGLRLHGAFTYHGAGTGRWSSTGVQLHNLPRPALKPALLEDALQALPEALQAFRDGAPLPAPFDRVEPAAVLGAGIRGCFWAPPGSVLQVGDFSGVEARVVAWLAGQERALETFRKGEDIYRIVAGWIYGKRPEDVTDDERQVGKVATLALGYQGAHRAFRVMGKGYGVHVRQELAEEIVAVWRSNNVEIVAYWKDIERAAIEAIATGREIRVGRVVWRHRKPWLEALLPSGRRMRYFAARLQLVETEWGAKETVVFGGKTRGTGAKKVVKWRPGEADEAQEWGTPVATYGGKLVENLVQAVSRDLLAEAMLRVHADGGRIVLHIHDEIVLETKEEALQDRPLERLHQVMAQTPVWATGCPIAVEGWQGQRYRK